MGETLTALEDQRTQLLQQIAGLRDFRTGSITVTTGRCGKPNCHCARPRDAGHGPNFRLTRKVDGTTVTETFPSPAALDKAQREVAEFHKFLHLSRALIDRKSTRLNSSHGYISYAVFCLKKKKIKHTKT